MDPKDPDRALIFAGNASSTCGTRGGAPSCPFSVWDISSVPSGGAPATLYSGPYPYTRYPAAPEPVQKPTGGLHSMTISNDGERAYFALLTGGFAIADVSDFADGDAFPQPRPITRNESRPTWPGPGAHSAVRLWGKDWAWVSDEVYGSATGPDHGCPWGWARMVDISDAQAPTVEAEYREPENDPDSCSEFNPPRTSYSAHNPTLTPHIAFSTWHSSGLEAISVADPERPYQLAEFTPEPLDSVLLEDGAPVLRRGHGPQREGRDVELRRHPGRPDLRRRPPQRPLHPPVPRPVQAGGRPDRLPRRQLQPGRRALLRAGRGGRERLPVT